jgi:ATP-binding cassette subfamily C protein CydD
MLSIGTLFAAAEWFALSSAAGAVVGHDYGVIGLCVAGMAIAGMLAALTMWVARRAQTEGRGAIARGIRASLAVAMMPSGRRSTAPEPARAAHALVEWTDDVADYHSTAGPLRVAAPIAMILILGLTAWVHWPAAIVLVLSTALVPLNMRLAGLFAQDGTDRHLVAMRRLSAMALDSFRGLHTLVNLGAVSRRRGDIDRASRALNSETMTVLRRAFLSGLIMDVVVTFSIAANATYIGLALLRYVVVPGVAPISLTSGLFVLMLCPMYFGPLRTMASAFHDRQRATSAARAITSLLAAEPDSSVVTAPAVTPAGPQTTMPTFSRSTRFTPKPDGGPR